MNSKNIMAVADKDKECTCMQCLKKGKVNVLTYGPLDYKSSFDSVELHLHVCDECLAKLNDHITSREVIETDGEYTEMFKYESEILAYFDSLPLQGQELLWNRLGDTGDIVLDGQDWIDYKLDELTHDVCKRYGLISPEERKAYAERFPVCSKRFLIDFLGNGTFEACSLKPALGPAERGRTYTYCYQCPYFKALEKENLKRISYSHWKDIQKCIHSYVNLLEAGIDPDLILEHLKNIKN